MPLEIDLNLRFSPKPGGGGPSGSPAECGERRPRQIVVRQTWLLSTKPAMAPGKCSRFYKSKGLSPATEWTTLDEVLRFS